MSDPPVAHAGEYDFVDTTGEIHLHAAATWPATFAPARGEVVQVQSVVGGFPFDAGAEAEIELASATQTITDQGAGSVPTPAVVALSSLDQASGDPSLIGQYVRVAPGSYTQNDMVAGFAYSHAALDGGTYVTYDGCSITDGTSTVLINLYRFSKATTACFTVGGAFPNFASGGVAGFYDHAQLDDGTFQTVLYFGDCADQ